LRDAYIEPWSVFERVDLQRFVGRLWLAAEIDNFLALHDRGYFVLEAPAGLGKTTFLAHLVKERGYLHHFVELARGLDGVELALKNLAAQIVRSCGLTPYSLDEVLPAAAAARPDFLATLLNKAAQQVGTDTSSAKIVIVVDGLDEAGTPVGQNVLGLPEVLPQGVYIIVSQRPAEVALNVDSPRQLCVLEPTAKHNLKDIRAYLMTITDHHEIRKALDESGISRDQLIDTLLERSQGVWIYLRYVVAEIQQRRTLLTLDSLPYGLWQYYARFWRRWRDEHATEWYDIHLPILATLGAVEHITFSLLCTLAGVAERPQLRRLLNGAWRPYLAIQGGNDPQYRLYHASLREFLNGQVSPTDIPSASWELAEELRESNRTAHGRIANRYLEYWGGLDEGLPGLSDSSKRDIDDRYGLRRLAAHLIGADRSEELRQLLSVEWPFDEVETHSVAVAPSMLSRIFRRGPKRIVWTHQVQRAKNAWHTALEQAGATSSYLQDVQRAWGLAEAASSQELTDNRPMISIGTEIRYALLTASVGSLAEEIPPLLISSLVALGRWTPDQAIAHVRQIPNEFQRAAAIEAVAPHLPEPLAEEVFEWAQALPTEGPRGRALAGIFPYLSQASQEAALAAVRAIAYEPEKAEALERLASHVPQADQYQLRVEVARIRANMITEHRANYKRELVTAIEPLAEPTRSEVLRLALANIKPHDALLRLWLLEAVVPILPDSLLEEALSIAKLQNSADENIDDDSKLRAETITTLLPYLREPVKSQALGEALNAAYSIPEGPEKSLRLVALLPYLDESEQRVALSQAVTAAESGRNSQRRADALIALLPHVAEPKRTQLRQEALTRTRAIYHPGERAKTLVALVPHLPRRTQTDAFKQIVSTLDEGHWSEHDLSGMLEKVAPGLPSPYRKELINRVLGAAAENGRYVFVPMIPRLPEDLLTDAVGISDSMSERDRLHVLAAVALRLQGQERQRVIEQALALPRELGDSLTRKEALAALAGYLPEEQLDEALTIARDVYSLRSRVEALAVAAKRLPSAQRTAVLHEALTTVLETRYEQHEKPNALAVLIPYLPEPLIGKAFSAVTQLESEYAQSEVLVAIAPRLPKALLPAALSAARTIGHERVDRTTRELRAAALAGILPRLPEPEASNLLREICATLAPHASEPDPAVILAAVRQEIELGNQPDPRAVRNLVIVAPYLPRGLLGEALDTAKLEGGEPLLISLAPQLAGPLRTEALNLARSYYSPADALAEFASYLPYPERAAILTEALSSIFATSHFERRTGSPTLQKIAKELSMLPRADLASVWRRMFPSFASRGRERLLIGIAAFAPVIATLGGPPAVQEASRAIQDVGRWLP
jgi:hypothetical protein